MDRSAVSECERCLSTQDWPHMPLCLSTMRKEHINGVLGSKSSHSWEHHSSQRPHDSPHKQQTQPWLENLFAHLTKLSY